MMEHKPCPFCGTVWKEDAPWRGLRVSGRVMGMGYVHCCKCGVNGPYVNIAKAWDAWDRRATPQPISDEEQAYG